MGEVAMAEMTGKELQTISRALADPRRFEILQHIAGSACMACSDLRTQFPIAAATLSHHLKELEAAGLIATERRGKFVDAIFSAQGVEPVSEGDEAVARSDELYEEITQPSAT